MHKTVLAMTALAVRHRLPPHWLAGLAELVAALLRLPDQGAGVRLNGRVQIRPDLAGARELVGTAFCPSGMEQGQEKGLE